jgi:hypothetical protein
MLIGVAQKYLPAHSDFSFTLNWTSVVPSDFKFVLPIFLISFKDIAVEKSNTSKD